ncbi:uncharacterized protein LOC131604261 [Vicia villosa]|uniref:uncharacterized protein LOC131604261 n=1 Tax=Vicia villosa TaxID=3911 RepID=UPI00273B8E7F|nr:uncharacterized protein LOC131604261 [Vicia villosa]
MAPPKPPNPSSKEILEEAIQISTLNLNNAMADTQEQLDVRFAQMSASIAQQVGELHTRLNAEKEDENSKFEALMAAIQKAGLQGDKQFKVTAAAAQSASTSGTAQNSSTISFGSPPFTHTLTPAHSPLRPSPNNLTSTPQPAVVMTSAPQLVTSAPQLVTSAPPSPFNTYPSYIHPQTVFLPPQPLSLPFPQPEFYPQHHQIPTLPPLRSPKLELSLFDGSNPLEWLFQADQFFSFYNMPPENRLSLVSFYMKGDALSWFKWMHQNRLLTTWGSFTRELELRFGPSTFENHQAELFKLKQLGSVMEYQTKFEQLGNKVIGLPAEAILNCFISGLQLEIQNELAIHKPTTISQAIGLAKLIESKLKDSKPKFSKSFPTNYPKQPLPHPTLSNPKALSSPTQNNQYPPKTPTTQQPKTPIRKLTQAQLQERRAQGLCFNCDEKFFTGHKCSTGRFLILIADDDISNDQPELEENIIDTADTDLNDTYFQLSPQAVTGQFSPQTLKFKGSIAGLPVMVLVDTGSTHNIMQPRIAHHLNLRTTPINQFSVMVGNGSHLQCEGICNQVEISLQNKPFTLPFYLLPIEGADIVLGMAWLRTLGPIQADFSIPSLTFQHQNRPLTLTGDPSSRPMHTTFHQLRQLIHTDSIASFHLLLFEPMDKPINTTASPTLDKSSTTLPKQIFKLLTNFQSIFQQPTGLPPPRPQDHHINLFPNTPPINVKPYRYPHSKKDAMASLIQQMLKDGTIIPSTSPFSSPVLLVKKKDGTWRFCVDYRALNAVTIKDRFPIPTIDELLDELGSATIFSKIDLCSGYHQIRVASKDTYKTAFRTFDGHYEFLVMPFGLTNGPSTFQSAMNDLLRPFLRRFVLVFFDDILIYSSNFSDHIKHLQVVFELLQQQSFFVKLSKCVFAANQIDYLGHIISASGVAPDPEKVKAILDWPQPRSLSTLRGFLGLTGFYRRFVQNYASLAAPLTDLLRSTKFSWSTEADSAFTMLKNKMTNMPVLALPDFTKIFNIDTDASGIAIGAVLSQEGHPIAFFSKKLCPRMQAASVYVREMLAITESVKKWRQYLIGHKFHIYTDQKSLRDLLLQRIQTPEQQRWTAKLQGFDFEISYKPGKSNLVADALSRKFDKEEALLLALSSPVPDLFRTLKKFYQTDRVGQQLLTLASQNSEEYSISQGLLYFKKRVYVPDLENLRQQILTEYHHTPEGGHSGVKATLARLRASFCWPGVYLAVKNMVKHCTNCQQNKYETQKKKGLLQPLPIPDRVWEDITMDFITNLPNSSGHTVVWVLCDRLSKFVHFLPLPTHFTARDLAARFTVEIFRLHGIPRSIVSDRDPLFLSKFWKHFFKLQGTNLRYSTSYHPETDGQTEVVNRSLETYLRCFAGEHPRKWHQFLHLAEYWYNTTEHTAIQMSPFKALYGRDPPKLIDYVTGSATEESLHNTLQEQHNVLAELKSNLKRSRIVMEKQANSKRRPFTFHEGDLVLLKLKPYRQTTVVHRQSQKLAKRYFGPYKVIKRIGSVDYLLDLPSSSRIHPVVHVSLLRKYHGEDPSQEFCPLPIPDLVRLSTINDRVTTLDDLQNKDPPQVSKARSNNSLRKDTRPVQVLPQGLEPFAVSANSGEESWEVTCKGSGEKRKMFRQQSRQDKAEKGAGVKLVGFDERKSKGSGGSETELVLNSSSALVSKHKGFDKSAPSVSNGSVPTINKVSRVLQKASCNPATHVSQTPHTAQEITSLTNAQSQPSIQIAPDPLTISLSPASQIPAPKISPNTSGLSGFVGPTVLCPNSLPRDTSTSPLPLNLEDKVLYGPQSNVMKTTRPSRIKKPSILLKDFIVN